MLPELDLSFRGALPQVVRRLRAHLRRKPNVTAALMRASSRLMAKFKPMLAQSRRLTVRAVRGIPDYGEVIGVETVDPHELQQASATSPDLPILQAN